jgi:hypothetical protein
MIFLNRWEKIRGEFHFRQPESLPSFHFLPENIYFPECQGNHVTRNEPRGADLETGFLASNTLSPFILIISTAIS